jgi:formylglycine-generating enzyme required for sulfatase activity
MLRKFSFVVLLFCTPLAALAQGKTAGRAFQDCPECPAMVVIPAGNFMMGSPKTEGISDEEPQHRVNIASFAVSETPITVAQWAAFTRETGYRAKVDNRRYGCLAAAKPEYFDQTDSHPVVCVNWNDTQKYVEWLSNKTAKQYRLLSEAEWEYAARAGTKGTYPFPAASISKYANHGKGDGRYLYGRDATDGYEFTSPVKTYPANRFGLYDMIGNVGEWTQDCWHGDYQGAPNDGSAWIESQCTTHSPNGDEARVHRGGDWDTSPSIMSSAARGASERTWYVESIGFRVARTTP